MARYSGKDLWASFDGTVIDVIRSVEFDEQANDIDASAARDTRGVFLAGLVSGQVSVEAMDDSDDSDTFDVFEPQNEGTLIVAPQGSVTGKKRFTAVAVCTQRQFSIPYDDVVAINPSLRLSEVMTEDVWP